MTNTSKTTRAMVEGAICIALAMVLSYLELDLWFQGGSISAVMIPLILFAARWGCGWGIGAGLVFGILKYFLSAGWALDWVSIIFDYALAYMAVGLAGFFKGKYKLLPMAALLAGVARFLIHFVSGVTVYAKYMPEDFLGLTMTNTWFYSTLYNGAYMLPNTILAVAVCAALMVPLKKFISAEETRR